MSFMRLAFSSKRARRSKPARPALAGLVLTAPPLHRLSSLEEGDQGVVVDVQVDRAGRADRLLSLGVTPGAAVTMLQRFPGVVFLCDQTELAVERAVADAVIVRPKEKRS
jgi:Fe2+ transport system protein FeoA